MWKGSQPTLPELLPPLEQDKIPALPLQFQYFPVEILSKEFTKLNSNHPYRIHYLGPRPLNTLALHKRYGCHFDSDDPQDQKDTLHNVLDFGRYRANLRKIINCNFISERLQQNHHYRSAIFYRAFQGMNPTLHNAKELIFNSAFQAGNLDCVIKIGPSEFDLFLRIDSNTRGHTAWYYFSLKNGNRLGPVTLNICNLSKPSCLYEQGMKPYVFSRRNWEEMGQGWQQQGQNCRFQAVNLRYEIVYQMTVVKTSYRLTFDYQFQQENDQVFFAYCIPYTYSQLQCEIREYEKSPFVNRAVVGKSLSGLQLPVLHVTNHQPTEAKKKNIIITGRVHPCESNSSYVLRGLIAFLLGSSKQAEALRNQANFFIMPMINPDGVILGNTRTSAAGKDLNRQFMPGKKQLYPQVYYIKLFTAKLQKRYGVCMFLDFHGHSRKKNTFLYGPNYPLSNAEYYKSRVLPRLIEKIDPKFRFYSCSFTIPEDKKTTARAVMLNQLKVPYSYTIESSIGLFYNPIIMKTIQCQKANWEQMGNSIGVGVQNFISALLELESQIRQRKLQRHKLKQHRLTSIKAKGVQEQQKAKKSSIFLDMIEEVKEMAALSKNMEEDAESDDHNEEEDLEGYKMREFNTLIIKGRQRQHNRMFSNKQEEEEDFNIDLTPNQLEDMAIEEKIIEDSRKVSIKSFRLDQPRTISKQVRTENRLKQKVVPSRQSLRSQPKKGSSKRNIEIKNFVLSNKERYSLITKSLFPIEDKCEILALPKSLQVMKREMKKGRLLINNLEQTRMKFFNAANTEAISARNIPTSSPFEVVDQSKYRIINGLSSTGYMTNDDAGFKTQRVGRSQSRLQRQAYSTLHCFEVDNLAMTISTFRRGR